MVDKKMSLHRYGIVLNSATYLVNTSVQDMESSLRGHEYDIRVLREALSIVKRRGEKTKAAVLARYVRKMEKEGV